MQNSLVAQWLGTQHFHGWGLGMIPGQGTKILKALWHGQKKKNTPTLKIPSFSVQPPNTPLVLSLVISCKIKKWGLSLDSSRSFTSVSNPSLVLVHLTS